MKVMVKAAAVDMKDIRVEGMKDIPAAVGAPVDIPAGVVVILVGIPAAVADTPVAVGIPAAVVDTRAAAAVERVTGSQ